MDVRWTLKQRCAAFWVKFVYLHPLPFYYGLKSFPLSLFPQNALYPLPDNHPNDTYFYELSIQTGYQSAAGTSSELFIILHGTLGESSPRKLTPEDRKCFEKGNLDNFLMAVPYSLGDLKAIEIWHNNTGETPGWFHIETTVNI